MADEVTPKSGFENPEEHNAKVSAELLAQDIEGRNSIGSEADHATTANALDKLAAESQAAKEKEKAASAEPVVVPKDDEKAKADEAAAKEKAEAEAAAKAKDGVAPVEEKTNLFDGVELPPNARPKSAEAFATVKERALREIESRDKTILDLQAKLKETEARPVVPTEVETELKELREWRAKLDVEVDPQFKIFDKTVKDTEDFIYAQLKTSPAVSDETIDQIKKLGGPMNVNMTKLFEAIKDPTLQRIVEAKVADIAMAKFNREQAIKSVKENVGKYLDERRAAFESSVTQHNETTSKRLAEFVEKMPWLKPLTAAADATPEQKTAAEEHNKFVTETNSQIQAALKDDSPEMRAIMIAGMAQLLNYQRAYPVVKAKLEATEKQLAEATEKLEKIKASSSSRLRQSAAPPGGKLPEAKTDPLKLNVRAGDALDELARQKMAERASASA